MGAADVVPGVSGGTIAFISGIYQELISSIHHLNLSALKNLKTNGLKSTWQQINGTFLLVLFLGIFISILSLSKLITHLLAHHPVLLWSFFFGLIIASILLVFKQITQWNAVLIIALIITTAVSYYITLLEPSANVESYGFLFISGFVAIIAMILPGVSGAFILLLIGSYEVVIGNISLLSTALKNGDFSTLTGVILKLSAFGVGAILGLKVFSGILHWMFKHHKNLTLAILTGFMIGSLNKIWPWKEIISTRINSKGISVPLLEQSIWPSQFSGNPQIMASIALMVVGFGVIVALDWVSNQKTQTS